MVSKKVFSAWWLGIILLFLLVISAIELFGKSFFDRVFVLWILYIIIPLFIPGFIPDPQKIEATQT